MDTASAIIERVRTRLEDPDGRFFSTADYVLAYNDALDELSDATELVENYITVKRRKWAAYTDLRGFLPPAALRVTAVWNLNSSTWLHPTTVRELDETLGRKWEYKPDDSRWWWMRGLYFLGAYPVPADDARPLRVYYSSLLPHVEQSGGLVTGLTTSAELPPDASDTIEDYMMYSLLVDKKESKKAVKYFLKYQQGESSLSNFSENRMSRDRAPRMGARR